MIIIKIDGEYIPLEEANIPEEQINELYLDNYPDIAANDIQNILLEESLYSPDYEPNIKLMKYLIIRLMSLKGLEYVENYLDDYGFNERVPKIFPLEKDCSKEKIKSIENEYLTSELGTVLKEELTSFKPNLKLMRYLIRRLTGLKQKNYINALLDNIAILYPLIPEIILYIIKSDLDENEKLTIRIV